MRHASLFSGIGGFDLAAEWAGWTNVFNCEIEDFPRRVLKYHFPNAIQYGNIKETDFTIHRGRIDVLTGGFPCQPFSVAGKRLGKNDERHLWPEMYRAIQQIKPKWIVGENVRGLLSWSDGLVLDEVYTDLENEGYEVQSFVLPAAGINAPHKRERVWIVAKNTMCSRFVHGESIQEGTEIREQWDSSAGSINGIHREEGNYASDTDNSRGGDTLRANREWTEIDKGWERQPQPKHRQNGINGDASNTDSGGRDEGDQRQYYRSSEWEVRKGESDNGNGVWRFTGTGGGNRNAPNTNNEGLQGLEINGGTQGFGEEREEQFARYVSSTWEDFPTQSPVCGGNDGIPDQLDDITVPKWRRESIKAYGNAIVPQIAYRIFQTINIMEEW